MIVLVIKIAECTSLKPPYSSEIGNDGVLMPTESDQIHT